MPKNSIKLLTTSNETFVSEVANNGRPMNASLSEDSVAETALSKKNSDGKQSV